MGEGVFDLMALILVNAVAASEGGALTILRQFLSQADCQHHYIVFVPDEDSLSDLNLGTEIKICATGYVKGIARLLWDFYGLCRYARDNKLTPDLVISLQNTPVFGFGKIPQVVYAHQAIPISSRKWSIFCRTERAFWFYKNIYPFFMRGLPAGEKYYVCQAEWMRSLYAKLLHVPESKVKVFAPDFAMPIAAPIVPDWFQYDRRFFVYPAQGYGYKNHKLIVDAVGLIKIKYPDDFSKLKIIFTLEYGADQVLHDHIESLGVFDAFEFVGALPYADLIGLFSSPYCALIFPSLIETVGLPLAEAAAYGCSIVSADLPYARETLSGYKGVSFVSVESIASWADAMLVLTGNCNAAFPIRNCKKPGWAAFFDFIEKVARHKKGNLNV